MAKQSCVQTCDKRWDLPKFVEGLLVHVIPSFVDIGSKTNMNIKEDSDVFLLPAQVYKVRPVILTSWIYVPYIKPIVVKYTNVDISTLW